MLVAYYAGACCGERRHRTPLRLPCPGDVQLVGLEPSEEGPGGGRGGGGEEAKGEWVQFGRNINWGGENEE